MQMNQCYKQMTRVHQPSVSGRIHKIQMNQQSSPKNTIMAPSGILVNIQVIFLLLDVSAVEAVYHVSRQLQLFLLSHQLR